MSLQIRRRFAIFWDPNLPTVNPRDCPNVTMLPKGIDDDILQCVAVSRPRLSSYHDAQSRQPSWERHVPPDIASFTRVPSFLTVLTLVIWIS